MVRNDACKWNPTNLNIYIFILKYELVFKINF